MRTIAIAVACLAAAPASAAEGDLQRARLANLGAFAGFVTSCRIASKTEADAMVKTLGAGLAEPWSDADRTLFETARRSARNAKCDDKLKTSVERAWSNYRDARR